MQKISTTFSERNMSIETPESIISNIRKYVANARVTLLLKKSEIETLHYKIG